MAAMASLRQSNLMTSERVPTAVLADAAGDSSDIPEALCVTEMNKLPVLPAECVTRSERDYATDMNNSFIEGSQAGTKNLHEESGRVYKAGFDHGFKNSQACYKAGYLEGNEADGKHLKRKCK